MQDKAFKGQVRDWLRTDEQRRFFDFVTDVPMDFAVAQAGVRWTEELIAEHLGIPRDRVPTLKKALRRAFQRQIKLLHVER